MFNQKWTIQNYVMKFVSDLWQVSGFPPGTPVSRTNKTVNFIWFLDVPTTFPNIIQTPNGPINEGNKVTLTCVIEGGNPLAAITVHVHICLLLSFEVTSSTLEVASEGDGLPVGVI
jgi:hypothetical protein